MGSRYDKRRFVESVSVAIVAARAFGGHSIKTRDVVNLAGELYDEIEHQYPDPREKDD